MHDLLLSYLLSAKGTVILARIHLIVNHRTLGPEYCANCLFFNEFYHDVDSSVHWRESQRTSIKKDVSVQVTNICKNAGSHL